MRQLTCSMSNDDFDDKSTKPPSSLGPTADKEQSQFFKTTKPWIWTSNTVDGASTRHRRETEQTPGAHLGKGTTEVARTQAVTTPRFDFDFWTFKHPDNKTFMCKCLRFKLGIVNNKQFQSKHYVTIKKELEK